VGHLTAAATCYAIELKTIKNRGGHHGAKKVEIELYKAENIFNQFEQRRRNALREAWE
jgi:hypothetical protein